MRLLISLAVCAVAYLAVAGSTTLWDRDEPRFARAAVEMVRGGDWLVPYFNGEMRLHKPVGVYWAMAGSILLFGVNEIAVRLPSIIGMLIAGLCTYAIGRRLLASRTAAWWAMVMFWTAGLTIYMGTISTADGLLIGCMTLAMWAGIEAVAGRPRAWCFVVLALALGAAQLVKGPVALLAWLSMALMAGFLPQARRSPVRWVGLMLALLASVGIFLAWAIPANEATGGAFLGEGVGEHIVARGMEAREGHGGSGWGQYVLLLPIYVPVIIGCFFPWIMHLPAGVSGVLRRHVGDRTFRTVVLCWFLPTFVVFSFYATKLPHYVLPTFPALALVCAAVMQAHAAGRLSEKDRDWLRGGVWFAGPVVVGVVALLSVLARSRPAEVFLYPATVVGVVVMLVGGLAIRWQLGEQLHRVSTWLVGGMVVSLGLAMTLIMPKLEQDLKIGPQLAAAVHEHFADPVEVAWRGYHEPSLVFYMDQPADMPLRSPGRKPEEVAAWAQRDQPGALIITAAHLERIEAAAGPLGLKEIARISSVNYSSGAAAVEVRVLARSARP
jgi:4-amino-4-deoxy-L-arabinose transferase-like glycosyltransferase